MVLCNQIRSCKLSWPAIRLFTSGKPNRLRNCRLILLLILYTLPAFLRAQEEFVQPPAHLLTKFTFRQFSGGVIVIRGTLNNLKDSLNFILDTGSGGISLDSETVVQLKLPVTLSDKTIRGIAGIRKVNFTNNNTLHLPGLAVDSLNFHINDYDILTSVYGEHIDGIVGFSFFSRYIVKIDYDSSLLYVYSKGSMKYPKGGSLLRPLLVNLLIQSARITDEEDRIARFYFDTGAGLCLLLSQDFVADSALFSSRKTKVTTQVEGLGGKKQMELTTVRSFKLGPYKFRRVPAYIFEDEFNVTSYPYLGGLIGNDLLRRFNVILNYEKRDVYIMPNSHYRDLFDYSYTGLNFYVINNDITITDVMKNSPAEKAGFQPDDIIMAVNNNFSKNIQAYKTAMQTPGEKIKVLIYRKGEPLVLTLKVKSIR
ncbi:MAG: aspartyl protease family protein [Bacteroidota bacterium]|nr:aspartyl protease family protein [Bacteroidota bacterium]